MKYLIEFAGKVRKLVNVDRFILFGSKARGDGDVDSDVDLLIISKDFEGVKFFKRAPMFYLLWNAPYDVDIICLTPNELARKSGEIGVVRQAMSEAVEL